MTISFKTRVTRAALSTVAFSRIGRLFPSAGARGVIFTLHHVRPKTEQSFDPNAHLEVTPEFLEDAIKVGKAAGLMPVRLEDLPVLLKNDDPKDRYMVFTLDDGYRNNAEYAAPVFRKHNVPYSIFICPGFVTRTRTMWWETLAAILRKADTITFDLGNGPETLNPSSLFAKQKTFDRLVHFVRTTNEDEAVERVNKLAQSIGFDPMSVVEQEIMTAPELKEIAADPLCTLGGHSLTHCNLSRIAPDRMRTEIERSCELVASYSNRPVKTFAYPYGWSQAAGPREFATSRDLGLNVAVTTQPGLLRSSDTANITGLKRVSLNGHFQQKRYVEALISGIPFRFI